MSTKITADFSKVPRFTKRTFKAKNKEQLTRSEQQSLSATIKVVLEELEYEIQMCSSIDKDITRLYGKEEQVSSYATRANKARIKRNKLAKIQYKLKRGI